MLKRVFRYLSGRPKNGDIVECIKPYIFSQQLVLAVCLIYGGFCLGKGIVGFFFAVLAVIVAWQAGWGMSIERFWINEKRSAEEFDKDA